VDLDEPSTETAGPAPAPGGAPYTLPPGAVVIGPIIVESGATLAIGLVMLLVGLAAGFLLRPLLPVPGGQPATGHAATAAVAAVTSAPAATAGGLGGAIEATQAAEAASQAAAIMAQVSGDTRHYLGDPNARVILIEYSDFQ
jgi:protein-disulfide isomerase